MPVRRITHELEIPFIDFDLSATFCPLISAPVKEKHGTNEVADPVFVQDGLKASFRVCGELFMEILTTETSN